MASTPTTNPVAVDVSQNRTVYLSCIAHAGYQQMVTASFNSDLSSPVATFTGSGENVPMTSSGQPMVSIPTGSQQKLYVLFQFSSGNGFQNAARVLQPLKVGAVTQITSEDSTDNDENDSYFLLVDTAKISSSRPAIVFASMETKKIQRLSPDGVLSAVIQSTDIPRGVAVDQAGGKIYWSEGWAHRIKRANLDGSGQEVIVDNSSNVYSTPLDLELDLTNQKIYWTDPGLKRVFRADLNGANLQQVLKAGAALGLALDLEHGKAYVGEGAGLSAQRIVSVNLDGSGMAVLFDTAALPNRDLMDLEIADGKLYWINGKEIEQCNLDGSGRTVLVPGLAGPRGMQIDRAAKKVYWTEGSKIRRAGLDGSGVETVYTVPVAGGLEHLAFV